MQKLSNLPKNKLPRGPSIGPG